jgi:hypothetical protein
MSPNKKENIRQGETIQLYKGNVLFDKQEGRYEYE